MSKPFKCTSCGGPVHYDGGASPTVNCQFCGSSIIVPEELRARPAASWGTGLVDGIFKLQERAANLQEVSRLARGGRKIEAIKLYREIFGVGLEEAKVAVERMAAGGAAEAAVMTSGGMAHHEHAFHTQGPTRPVKRSAGVWVFALLFLVGILVTVGLVIRSAVNRVVNRVVPTFSGSSSSHSPSSSSSSSTTGAPGFATVALKFGSEGIGPGMFKDARNIGVDAEGRIYVGEYISGRIQAFDTAGKFVTQWIVDPKMPMRQLAADRKGTVYVVQRGEISRFEGASGNALGKVSYGSGGRAYFDDARATPDGGLIAVVNDEDIVRFNAGGQVVKTLSKPLSAQTGDPERIESLAVDGLGNIYALGGRETIFKFSPDGKYINQFGGPGSEPGQLRAAQAIAVDGQGRLYASDIKGIQVFDPNGRYLDAFKVDGSVAFGMVFNDRNELFVAARTQVIKYTLNK
jgi:sugar lactone lactonase YvrE/DNA-directed RNA polymerase subunit RPC12/RpoP